MEPKFVRSLDRENSKPETQTRNCLVFNSRMPQMHARTTLLLTAMVLANAGCAAVQPLNAGGPRSNQPPYPVVLEDTAARIESANVTWAQLLNRQGASGKPVVTLRPITATIQ